MGKNIFRNLILIVIILIVFSIFEVPNIIKKPTITGFVTNTSAEEISEIYIDYISPTIKLEFLNKKVYVDFVVVNNLEIPYDVTVYWILDGRKYLGWKFNSQNIYSPLETYNKYNSWFPISDEFNSNCQVQIILEYKLNGEEKYLEEIRSCVL